MTLEERLNQINGMEPEEPTAEDLAALKTADTEGLDSAMTLEEFADSLSEYSGRIIVRIPRSLHKELKMKAAIEGVSLNQYMLYKLAQ